MLWSAVHVDLEDPTLLEIAELLDSQAGDKYTLMLLRNGDDLDHASFVQVQMFEDDDAMRWVCVEAGSCLLLKGHGTSQV